MQTIVKPLTNMLSIAGRPVRPLAAILFMALLPLACSEIPTTEPPPEQVIETIPPPAVADIRRADELLALAESSLPPEQVDYLLEAAEIYLDNGYRGRADNLLQLLDPETFTLAQKERYIILGSTIAIGQHNPEKALALLNDPHPYLFTNVPLATQKQLTENRAAAWALSGNPLQSIQERVYGAAFYRGDEVQVNNDRIWQTLSLVSVRELKTASATATDRSFKGWLDLALAIRSHPYDAQRQRSAYREWQSGWPSHAAAGYPPSDLRLALYSNEQRLERITLAVPLSGRLANLGSAVRDGFLAAYYHDVSNNPVPTQIRIIDSATYDTMPALYQATVAADNPDLVIGGLDKGAVAAMQQLGDLPVPFLSLNRSATQRENPDNLFQFGLSPEDEGIQLAELARVSGYRSVAAIISDNSRDRRTYGAFQQRWQEMGGQTAGELFFNQQTNLKSAIGALVGTVDRAERSSLVDTQAILEGQEREMDFLFLISTPQQASLINPILDFHFANDLPVLTTSQVHVPGASQRSNRDLNRIMFVDIPWVFNPQIPFRQAIEAINGNTTGQYSRIHALGVDTYLLSTRLEQMRGSADTHMEGTTGLLYLDHQNLVHRKLPAATFIQGKPVPVTTMQLRKID